MNCLELITRPAIDVFAFITSPWKKHSLDFLLVLAEFSVAWVIYIEFQANLTYQALDTIYVHLVYKGRKELYELFYSVAPVEEKLATRQEKFRAAILANPKRLKTCDEQIAQFTKLGYLLRPRWLKWRGYGPDDIVEFLPHVVGPLAVMLLPYIKQRRNEKGRYYAQHFIGLAIACVKKLEESYPHELVLFGKDRANDRLTVTRSDLDDTRKGLEHLWSQPIAEP